MDEPSCFHCRNGSTAGLVVVRPIPLASGGVIDVLPAGLVVHVSSDEGPTDMDEGRCCDPLDWCMLEEREEEREEVAPCSGLPTCWDCEESCGDCGEKAIPIWSVHSCEQ